MLSRVPRHFFLAKTRVPRHLLNNQPVTSNWMRSFIVLHEIIWCSCHGSKNFSFLFALYTCFKPSGHSWLILWCLRTKPCPSHSSFLAPLFGCGLSRAAQLCAACGDWYAAERTGEDADQCQLGPGWSRGQTTDQWSRGEVVAWRSWLEVVAYPVENKSQVEPSTSKVHFLLPSCYFILNTGAFMFNHKMRSKTEEMDCILEDIIT